MKVERASSSSRIALITEMTRSDYREECSICINWENNNKTLGRMKSIEPVMGNVKVLSGRTSTIACFPAPRLVLVEIHTFLSARTIPGSTWPASSAARRGEDGFDRNILGYGAQATT